MIKWVRLDERMIHGQVATKWSRTLGVDRIVVADDTAAASDIMQKSLMMAAPTTCKTAIVTVDHHSKEVHLLPHRTRTESCASNRYVCLF